MSKVWLITGISRGLGFALAAAALDRGDRVVGTTRDGGVPDGLGEGLTVVPFEATDHAAVARVIERAFAKHGRIDVLVNNAGYGLLGSVEASTEEEMRHLFDVNVFGPVRLIREALPRLRAQERGHIINIASIAGVAPAPGSGLYGATKAALSAMSYSLAAEVAPMGLWVSVVSPGAFRTDFLAGRSLRRTASSDAYAPVNDAVRAWRANDGHQAGDPTRAAEAILALVDADEPPLDLLLGADAIDRARVRFDRFEDEVRGWESLSRATGHRDQQSRTENNNVQHA